MTDNDGRSTIELAALIGHEMDFLGVVILTPAADMRDADVVASCRFTGRKPFFATHGAACRSCFGTVRGTGSGIRLARRGVIFETLSATTPLHAQ